MRIKEISLKNFKRFTDLTIKDIPESAKLVLLIGANGSGKTSVFDAFSFLSDHKNVNEEDFPYYLKNAPNGGSFLQIAFNNGLNIEYDFSPMGWSIPDEFLPIDMAKLFYGRSSIRIVPRIPLPDLQKSILDNEDAPGTFIDHDVRFNTDIYEYIREINKAVRSPFIQGKQVNGSEIFQEYFAKINDSFAYIFGEGRTAIKIIDMVDSIPGVPAELIFQKGYSKVNYDLLSHGEKQVVTLLLDFLIRNKYYQDTIYFIDEMDTHLETTIQKRLIENVVEKWIPNGSQLWTASHALGFIEYANKSDDAVIVDFDSLDFDIPQVITPSKKDILDVYEIALPKSQIASILKGYKLVVVENKNDVHLNEALGQNGYIFLPANNNREVFLTIKGDRDKLGLRDRDYLKDSEIAAIKKQFPNLKILSFYTFENYIYHPDNIAELGLAGYDQEDYIKEIIRQKQEKLIPIVAEIGISRTHYIEFKEGIVNDTKIEEITDALQSNELNIFYPYFNMKTHFNKAYLNSFQYTISQLAQTTWFKAQIQQLLS